MSKYKETVNTGASEVSTVSTPSASPKDSPSSSARPAAITAPADADSTPKGPSIWDKAKYLVLRAVAAAAVAAHKAFDPVKKNLKIIKGGKAIYRPGGKAKEYALFATNIFKGCPGPHCLYCYLFKGKMAKTLGTCLVSLKACFKSERSAVTAFFNELFGGNGGTVRPELLEHGIFFTFISDPGLPQTFPLFAALIAEAVKLHVPIQFLTKRTAWLDSEIFQDLLTIPEVKDYLVIGLTLTGRDDMEPGASPNSERILALRRIHDLGFRCFASVEPVILTSKSLAIVQECAGFVDLFRVGLLAGGEFKIADLRKFADDLAAIPEKPRIYLKDGLVKRLKRTRESYGSNFVDADYRPWNHD